MTARTRAVVELGDNQGPAPVGSKKLRTGSIIAGRFQLERSLGEGGMGAVWSARHLVTNRAVAIKFLKGPANLDLIQRFVRESQAASTVRHPNVVAVHDVLNLEDGLPALVMDLYEGETLARRLERRGALPLPELVQVMTRIVSALAAIHAAGVVHRDLKPENVFLAQLGDGRVEPIILDFGICKLEASWDSLSASDASTTGGRIMGTPCYMAPEQIVGAADVDARADMWALGVMFYECISGERPWDGDSMAAVIGAITSGPIPQLRSAVPAVPPELAHTTQRLLLRDRNARLSSLAEVSATLDLFRTATSEQAPRSPVPERSRLRLRGRPERDAETLARARQLTLSGASVSTSVNELASRPRRTVYLSVVFACAALLGGLVALQNQAASAQGMPVAAAPLAAPADLQPEPPLAIVPVDTLPVEDAPASAEDAPASAEATDSDAFDATARQKTPLRSAPAPRKRFQNGLYDYGGRR